MTDKMTTFEELMGRVGKTAEQVEEHLEVVAAIERRLCQAREDLADAQAEHLRQVRFLVGATRLHADYLKGVP